MMNNIASLLPIGCPKGVPAHEWREAVAAQIENLLDQVFILTAMLDQMDGDADIEENGDERDQSFPEGGRGSLTVGAHPHEDDEDDDPTEDDDAGEDNGDDEPSLGGPGQYHSGGFECDLEADTADNEPFLGWSEYQSENGRPSVGSEFGEGEFGRLHFDASGYRDGLALLAEIQKKHPRRSMQRISISPGLW